MMDYTQEITAYFDRLKVTIDKISKSDLSDLMNVLVDAKESGKQIFIMGNGGSSATASHYVCDFNKGISMNQDKKFKFICLNDNIPSLMAYANDLSFEDIFVEQLKNFYQKGDIVIGISGSGNSINVVVTPSDALVIDVIGFRKVIAQALSFTQERKAIVTIGVKPSRPETGYGYIKTFSSSIKNEVVKVEAFKEKPNRKVAEDYLADGHYFWNVGIFVWHVDMIMEAIRKYTPELARVMDNMSLSFYTDDEKRVIGELFPTCEKISIDYAVMEKAKEVYMLSAEFGWSDLGSWGSLHSLLPQDMDGNSAVGSEVRMIDCAGCVVHTSDERKVVIEGLKDYIVAEKNGQLLICRLRNEQMIKEWGR